MVYTVLLCTVDDFDTQEDLLCAFCPTAQKTEVKDAALLILFCLFLLLSSNKVHGYYTTLPQQCPQLSFYILYPLFHFLMKDNSAADFTIAYNLKSQSGIFTLLFTTQLNHTPVLQLLHS